MPSNEIRKIKSQETTLAVPDASKPNKRVPNGPLASENAKAVLDLWMHKWLDAAERAATVIKACEDSGVTMSQYIQGRLGNTTFDAACLLFEQIVELRIIEGICIASEGGNAHALGLYFKSVRRPSFAPAFPSWNALPPPPIADTPLPVKVADAMITAGLKAFEELPPPDGVKR